ncbi:MAG: DUF1538 domain-containing protein [Methanosarcina mazei]|jgi:hypothetical protein|uniref:Permease of the major facilitator superfamily n=3 Tax=Methanosarcina mazei TaxID=2209 RepID=A0A0E3RDK8_METMZ|nr:DUF1538 domain-containing protein [Methanosarcina mazei]AKB63570.1 Permease of the major facilitator superfamily [Methanosarcina mazei S-6]AKB66928.1 Permease of the major facilitator superfamily [Methanosarcina mazei LYC]MDY0246939.1 DUF1538 domain-containing protein [Methanosarcina mazei]TAH64075.1 MAG: DUF1538 domain-containing protein [Methanosarcina mazei]WIM44175.1 DUF1538 domain-containing protein [Methanosarcina mazei]
MMRDFKETFLEVIQAVLPLTLAVIVIMLVFLGSNLGHLASFLTGTIMVIAGMTFFLMGVKLGMLPMGEAIGSNLPKHGSLIFIAVAAFFLSFLTTVAEPDVRVLSSMIDSVSKDSIDRNILIVSIGVGVGFFVTVSILRIIYGIPIKYLFAISYLLIIFLSFITPAEFRAISFDAGGVTTGPMTVPVIMALGIGTASVLQERSQLSEGFGLIGFASIGPILSLMLLGVLSS